MDWKSTAVISSAGVLATWFFSMPPAQQTVSVPSAPAARATQGASSSQAIDIQQEAARLQPRTPKESGFNAPARNPFRFSEPPQPVHVAAPAPVVAPVAPLPPLPPRITLDGVASDTVDGVMQRTAILNTDSG